MKVVTVILVSVLLILSQVWLAPTASGATCARVTVKACCQHGAMPCCTAKASSPVTPVSTVPLRTNLEAPLLVLLALNSLLPSPEARSSSGAMIPSSLLSPARPPLYERDCARLL